MPIKFSCPNCKKLLQVKDELAGKRGACPACKKVIAIPARTAAAAPIKDGANPERRLKPPSKPGLDLEAIAAAALSEKPQTEETQAAIDFTCPFCDAELHVGLDLAGKQTPCSNPECRRIVKVPMPAKTAPRDWRKPDADTMPSGAKRQDAAPEGAWGTETTRASVSRESLVEAAALKEVRPPTTWRQWLVRGVALAVVLLFAGAGVYFFLSYRQAGQEERALQLSLEAMAGAELSWEQRADLEQALAEYYQATGERDQNNSPLAMVHLQLARQAIERLPQDSADRLASLRNLTRFQLANCLRMAEELSAMAEESPEKIQLSETLTAMVDELGETLAQAPAGGFRHDLIRELVRQSLPSDPTDSQAVAKRAEQLRAILQQGIRPRSAPREEDAASQPANTLDFSEQLNALGILGQELARIGQPAVALRIADSCRTQYQPSQPVPHQLVTLLHVMQQPELPGVQAGELTFAARAQALAMTGQAEEAGQFFEDRFRTSTSPLVVDTRLTLAEFCADKDKERAESHLKQILNILSNYPLNDMIWERQRVVELAIQCGLVDDAEQLTGTLLTGPGQSRARLAVLRHQLQQSGDAAMDFDQATNGWKANTAGYCTAALLIARHNARLDPAGTLSWVETAAPESVRPFAALGVALGMRDRLKKASE